MNQAEMLEAVRAAVATTGLPVIIGQYDPVRLAVAGFTLQVVTDEEFMFPRETFAPSYAVSATRSARVQVSGFGSTTWSALVSLAALLMSRSSTQRTAIVAAGVVPQRTTGPRNASAPYRTGILPSYVLDVVVQYVTEPTAEIGVSPAAGIWGSVAEEGGEVLDPAYSVPEV